jgi:hypothetical protein
VIDLGHHVKSYDGLSASIPQRTEGLIVKMAEITVAWKLIELNRFINVSRTFFKKSS